MSLISRLSGVVYCCQTMLNQRHGYVNLFDSSSALRAAAVQRRACGTTCLQAVLELVLWVRAQP